MGTKVLHHVPVQYPVRLDRDEEGRVVVSFPDVPEARGVGEYEADARLRATDALATALGDRIRLRRDIPVPSVRPGRPYLRLPALFEVKLRLYEAMRAANLSKAELARRLQWHRPQIDRLFALWHGSKLEQLEAAAAALGKRMTVSLDDLPADHPPAHQMPASRPPRYRSAAVGGRRRRSRVRSR